METTTFQCADCTEILPMSEVAYSATGKVFVKHTCNACYTKQEQEANEWDGEPVTSTEYWDSVAGEMGVVHREEYDHGQHDDDLPVEWDYP